MKRHSYRYAVQYYRPIPKQVRVRIRIRLSECRVPARMTRKPDCRTILNEIRDIRQTQPVPNGVLTELREPRRQVLRRNGVRNRLLTQD